MTTLYLKYRPQKFQELDSTEAREELIKTFSSGKLPHAFLFTGPKGIGKTSAARIAAKAVNCTQSSVNSKQFSASSKQLNNYEPCGECTSCKEITLGNSMDVLEIDAASNTGVEDIRELRDKINLAPSSSKYKVYIIDEVHMLSNSAFNAFLKTLEEPPKHVVFILCTTDPEKLPKTIVSRCQKINFKKATKAEIVGRLKFVCEKEKIEFEEEALEQIAKHSEGGFRDAVKILEQVSYSGKITKEDTNKIIGLSTEYKVSELLDLVSEGKTKDALFWIGKAYEAGINLKVLTESIIDNLHVQLLSKYGLTDENEEKQNLSIEEIKKLINLFTAAYSELRFAVVPQLPLELAVIEAGGNSEEGKDGGGLCVVGRVVGEKGEEVEKEKKDKEKGEQKEQEDQKKETNKEEVGVKSVNFTLEEVIIKWPEILERVKPLNHSVLAFLRAAKPFACENGYLILEVSYKFHKDQLESEKCRKIFEDCATEIMGTLVRFKCNLSEKKTEAKPMPIVDQYKQPADYKPPKIVPASPYPQRKPAVVKPVVDEGEQMVKMAEEIFNTN